MIIKRVGELHFTDLAFRDEMLIDLQKKNFLLEPIYADKLIVGYKIYQRMEDEVYE